MAKWFNSTLIRAEKQSETTRRFWLQVIDNEVVNFRAGQFVTMDLPIHEKRLKRWRSYSIANPPDDTNVLEFSIVHLKGGLGTTYLFEDIKIGDTIKFKQPAGVFILPADVSEKDLVFICTGTGIAPFRSMIFDLINNKKPFKSIHLIFGTRTKDGILYREEFEKLTKELPNFTYDIALSREKSWYPTSHTKGYVHQIYQKKHAEIADNKVFYLCGWSNMVDEAVANLEQMGYDKSQIIFELYG